jgi:CHASE3 domain sensor protein
MNSEDLTGALEQEIARLVKEAQQHIEANSDIEAVHALVQSEIGKTLINIVTALRHKERLTP